jgi:hypothetical protein
VNAAYAPTATMNHLAVQSARREQPVPGARLLSRRANRLASPNIDPNNGRHARWCPCAPGYVCEDHRLRL